MDITKHEDYPSIIIVMCILALFSFAGTLGNAFVIYVYAKKREKSTTTMFILTLAGTDFFTCLVIVPYTIVWEYYSKRIQYDIVCKVYHFFITSNVPFSAFIMVAIAFDRYFKICRPLSNVMDPPIAKRIIFGLLGFAIMLGIITSLAYEVYSESTVLNSYVEASSLLNISRTTDSESVYNKNLRNDSFESRIGNQPINVSHPDKIGKCISSERFISNSVRLIYQKMYASLFLIAFITVVVLYGLIFRSIVTRRSKKMKKKLLNGYSYSNKNNSNVQSATTCNMMTQTCADGGTGNAQRVVPDENGRKEDTSNADANETTTIIQDDKNECIVKQRRRSIKEKQRIANIKTAGILFIVTIVFIVAFLPAWLMATRMIRANIILFYMYFSYNVANPIIYAFFNKAFRQEMEEAIQCVRTQENH